MPDPIIPDPPEVAVPEVVSSADPDAAKKQGLAPPGTPGLVEVLCTSDACVNGIRYEKDSSYLLDPDFASQFSFFSVKK